MKLDLESTSTQAKSVTFDKLTLKHSELSFPLEMVFTWIFRTHTQLFPGKSVKRWIRILLLALPFVLGPPPTIHQVSIKLVKQFLRNPDNTQTNRNDNITSLGEPIITRAKNQPTLVFPSTDVSCWAGVSRVSTAAVVWWLTDRTRWILASHSTVTSPASVNDSYAGAHDTRLAAGKWQTKCYCRVKVTPHVWVEGWGDGREKMVP